MAEPAIATDLRPVEPVPAVPQTPVTQIVSGIIDDASRLAKQQVDMLKSEFQEDLRRTRRALEFGGIGIVLGTTGMLALVFCLVEVLHEQFGFKQWSAALIVGGILTAGGAVLGYLSFYLFESFNPLPDKTFNALQENLTWKTSPQT
jgi:hypothetical protein